MITYNNLDKLKAFKKLESLPRVVLKELMCSHRWQNMVAGQEGLYQYFYAGKPIGNEHLAVLQELADEAQLINKFHEVVTGKVMNLSEGRMVLHHLTRGILSEDVLYEGLYMGEYYQQQIKGILNFAQKVHTGKIKGSTQLPFKNVVQVGIGGSDLGPQAIYLALKGWANTNRVQKLKAYFISNVDPDDAHEVLENIELEQTLFILVSKGGTTQETLTNEQLIRNALKLKGLNDDKHFISVTSKDSPLANNPRYLASFYIDNFIGGRYSSTSAVGLTILALSLGKIAVEEFLKGAHEADLMALSPRINANPALLDALLGVYERNLLDMRATAILPYSQALRRFPAHLQQLDMESNGKSVNRYGEPVDYETGPLIFGEAGTNGQHSFYQFLHQGTDIIPLQFIGFGENQYLRSTDLLDSTRDSQRKLKANLIGQILAFTKGHSEREDLNKNFEGNRPVSLLWAKQLTPYTMGAILSHYENKIMFQGFLWNINSFDQEGVQLGKVLTQKILDNNEREETLRTLETLVFT